MEIQDILDGLEDFERLQQSIKKTSVVDFSKIKKQYDPKQHDVVKNIAKRPDKTIVVADPEGGEDAQGNPKTITKTVFVSRLPIPFQKRIVERAAAFLCGNPVEIIAQAEKDSVEDKLLKVLRKTWDDNKLDYESKRIAKLMMSETEVAELWYSEEAKEGYWKGTPNDQTKVKARLRVKILANSLGDSLYPVFNAAGDMIAFGRGYVTIEGSKKIQHFDLYTDETNYLATKVNNKWEVKEEINVHKKIPVIYYSQDQPEWYDVQEMIDRIETLISNHADTNDYYGSPMVKVKGKVMGFSSKGESGKVLEIEGDGDADYLTWDQSPESVRMEYNNLRSLIMDMTDTPDISFEQVKGLGNYSGIALKMLFLGAHMKAADKEETFGKGIQRRLNFLKSALAVVNSDFEPAINLSIKPKFKYFLPKNDLEEIQILTTATMGDKPIMSQETAIELNPLVEDKDGEKDRVKDEREEEETSPRGLDNVVNLDAA